MRSQGRAGALLAVVALLVLVSAPSTPSFREDSQPRPGANRSAALPDRGNSAGQMRSRAPDITVIINPNAIRDLRLGVPENVPLESGRVLKCRFELPQADHLWVTVQKREHPWDCVVTLARGEQTVATARAEGDLLLEVKEPAAGEYDLRVEAVGSGRLMVCAQTNLPSALIGESLVGTIYRNDGYDWAQLEVPPGLRSLHFVLETVGNVAALDVWRGSLDSAEHWHAEHIFNPPVRLAIEAPAAGRYYLRAYDHGQLPGSQVRDYSLSVQPVFPLLITTSALPAGTATLRYAAPLGVLGGRPPYTWSLSGGQLPDGLQLAQDTGEIAGVPTTVGEAAFQVEVGDGVETVRRDLSIEIAPCEPRIDHLAPAQGPNTGPLAVLVAGSCFQESASVELAREGVTIPGAEVQVPEPALLRATFDLTDRPLGDYTLVVETGGVRIEKEGALRITLPPPVVQSVSPAQQAGAGAAVVTISGGEFQQGAIARFSLAGQPEIEAASVEWRSTSELRAAFDLANRPTGFWDVVVVNPDGLQGALKQAFQITPAPILYGLSPSGAQSAGSTSVTLRGAFFQAGARVRLRSSDGAEIPGTHTVAAGNNEIRTTFDLSDAPAGLWDAVVGNPDGGQGELREAFTTSAEPPLVAGVSPAVVPNTMAATLTVTGHGLKPGATTTLSRAGDVLQGQDLQIQGDGELSVRFDLAGRTPGPWLLSVSNPDGKEGRTLVQVAVPPRIDSVTPDRALNHQPVAVRIVGADFQPGAVAKLVSDGAEIIASNTQVSSAGEITADLDVASQPVREWGLIVVNPDGLAASPVPFQVQEARTELWVEIYGRNTLRPGRPATFLIEYGNAGNIPIYDVLLLVDLPCGFSQRVDSPCAPVPTLGLAWDPLPPEVVTDPDDDSVLWIYGLEPGARQTLRLTLTPLPLYYPNGGRAALGAWILDPEPTEFSRTGDLAFLEQASNFGLFVEGLFFTYLNRPYPSVAPPGRSRDVGHCQGRRAVRHGRQTGDPWADNVRDWGRRYGDWAKGEVPGRVRPGIGAGWGIRQLPKIWGMKDRGDKRTRPFDIPFSRDPNAKAGDAGYDPPATDAGLRKHFIAAGALMGYVVFFENDPEKATAPAQEVVITDQLSPDLDGSTVELGDIVVGDRLIPVPAGRQEFSTVVDLRPAFNTLLEVDARLDRDNGLLRWCLKGTDPDTGEFADFLPPNHQPPEGEGQVAFRVRARPDLPTGTAIRNRASIVFDVNPPMETEEVLNTIDAGAPDSAVTPLADIQASTRFQVAWSGQDDEGGAGVQDYTVYVSEDGAPYRPWLTTSETSARFTGRYGHSYRFYSVARDPLGHGEEVAAQPDATTTIGRRPDTWQGLSMVSLPLMPDAFNPAAVVGFPEQRWARYDPARSDYVYFETDSQHYTWFEPAPAVPGRGYWARFLPGETEVPRGVALPEDQPVRVPLRAGWNMIGPPYLSPVPWDLDAILVQPLGGLPQPLRDASEVVDDYVWTWQPDPEDPQGGTYALVYDSGVIPGVGGVLEPWRGYWIRARQDCELILPPPEQQAGRSQRAVEDGRAWSLRFQVSQGAVQEAVTVGVAQSRALAAGRPPDPPRKASPLRVSLLSQTGPLAVDVRRAIKVREVWDLMVESESAGEGGEGAGQVVLSWPDLRTVPGDVSLVLVDRVAGVRRYLRTTSHYAYRPGRGETSRRFQLIAERGRERALQISGLRATQTRGGTLEVRFTLSREAATTVRVRTLTGRTVSDLEPHQPRQATEQMLRWDGRDDRGRRLPAGVYLVEVQATDQEGREVRAVTTLMLF